MRAILIRDPNRMVAAAVLSCPKVNEAEVEAFAKMGNVSEEILRTIAMSRAWTKSYGVLLALVKNSKTPVALTMNMMQRLNESDVKKLSTDRNVPEALRLARAEADGREPASSADAAARRLRPFRSHLRQAVHVDGDALALFLARQRLQQVDRAIEVVAGSCALVAA